MSDGHECKELFSNGRVSRRCPHVGALAVTQVDNGVMVETTNLRPRQRFLATDRVDSGEKRLPWVCYRTKYVVLLPASGLGANDPLGGYNTTVLAFRFLRTSLSLGHSSSLVDCI